MILSSLISIAAKSILLSSSLASIITSKEEFPSSSTLISKSHAILSSEYNSPVKLSILNDWIISFEFLFEIEYSICWKSLSKSLFVDES